MNLLLWRHAEAVDASANDLQRALTAYGQQQAQIIAHWLKPRLHRDTKILVSPALRTQQTVRALSNHYQTVEQLAPGATVANMLTSIQHAGEHHTLIMVGHQPTLGQLASFLMTGHESSWNIQKGALWWFVVRRPEDFKQTMLHTVLSPELLKQPE